MGLEYSKPSKQDLSMSNASKVCLSLLIVLGVVFTGYFLINSLTVQQQKTSDVKEREYISPLMASFDPGVSFERTIRQDLIEDPTYTQYTDFESGYSFYMPQISQVCDSVIETVDTTDWPDWPEGLQAPKKFVIKYKDMRLLEILELPSDYEETYMANTGEDSLGSFVDMSSFCSYFVKSLVTEDSAFPEDSPLSAESGKYFADSVFFTFQLA